jgi:hypothetical protein
MASHGDEKMDMHWIRGYLVVAVGSLCAGCVDSSSVVSSPSSPAGAPPAVAPTPGVTATLISRNGKKDSDVVTILYEPDPAHLPHLTSTGAVSVLNDLLAHVRVSEQWAFGAHFNGGWTATREGIRWQPTTQFGRPTFYPYKSIDRPCVLTKGIQGPATEIGIHEFHFSDPNQRSLFVDALFVMARAAQGQGNPADEQEQAAFEAAVKIYRSQNPRPTLSEDIRRLAVQADTAATDGKYKDASQLYGQIVAGVPWWPKAHYNLAVLLAEQSDFTGAIQEMRRYLALAPDAADARAAQDVIYQWEYRQKTKTEK